jgi:ElaB/YqjD/DUF883 family membrane-anchored ribosome-binding protein
MPDETEMIRHQMEETRSALTEKLETLEHTVTDTVAAATDTVANMRDSVQDTVQSVKDSVQDTVQSVKESFDISAQVDRHPWLSLGGSVLAGYLVGHWLHRPQPRQAMPAAPAPVAPPQPVAKQTNGWHEIPQDRFAAAERPAQKSWLQSIAEQYSGELDKLKGLAIGATLGLVRDSLVQSAPEPFRPQLSDVIDTLTRKLGGETIRGPILSRSPERTECETTAAASPMGASRWQD